jgi:hypothetical protein
LLVPGVSNKQEAWLWQVLNPVLSVRVFVWYSRLPSIKGDLQDSYNSKMADEDAQKELDELKKETEKLDTEKALIDAGKLLPILERR